MSVKTFYVKPETDEQMEFLVAKRRKETGEDFDKSKLIRELVAKEYSRVKLDSGASDTNRVNEEKQI